LVDSDDKFLSNKVIFSKPVLAKLSAFNLLLSLYWLFDMKSDRVIKLVVIMLMIKTTIIAAGSM